MGGTHFGGGVFQYGGQPVGGAPGASPFGNAYYVSYSRGSDANDGKTPQTAFKLLSTAIDAVTSNNNDVIYVDGYSAVVETAMIDLSKNRVTIIGCNGIPGMMGQGARINIGVTTDTDDIALIQNTGVRNCFVGLKFESENTLTEAKYCFAEGGEFTRFYNCSFYKSTHLDVTDASECLCNGDTAQFFNCTFGSTVNITADNYIRPSVSLTATISGKKARDVYFENCLFLSKSAGTEHVDVYGANATDVERMLLMKNCTFLSNTLGAATPAHAVGFGAAQTEGTVLLQDCASVDHTVMAQASVGIYVAGAVPTFATTGVSKAS
jgi:hypothetical protein